MRFVSTKTHGRLDYLSVPMLLALPRLFGWNPTVRTLLTGSAIGTLAYSLLTDYELGVVRVLPMPAHLGLDAMSGAFLLAAPWLLGETDRSVTAALMGIGAFELGAALTTQTEPADEDAPAARSAVATA